MVPGHRGLRRACTNSQEVALRQMSGRDKTLIDRVDCWVGVLVIGKSGLLFVPAGPPQGRGGQLPASHPQADVSTPDVVWEERRSTEAVGDSVCDHALCVEVKELVLDLGWAVFQHLGDDLVLRATLVVLEGM